MSSYTLVLDTDQDIIREYCEKASDRAATAFVRKYQKFVYATALRYLKNSQDAEDAAQEAFIKALNNLQKFRGESSVSTWLYRITVNVATNMLRKNKFKSLFKSEPVEDMYDLLASDTTPETTLRGKEIERSLLDSLAKLPEKQRETFSLRYFDELSYEEISKMLGTSVGGLKANYFQAVQKLAKLMSVNS